MTSNIVFMTVFQLIILAAYPNSAPAQYTLSGRLTTIPSLEPAIGRVTVRDTATGEWWSTLSNGLTGDYSITGITAGRKKVTIEFQPDVTGLDTTKYHFCEKNEDVSSDKTIDLRGYPFNTSKSTYEGFKGKSILEIHKIMSRTRGAPVDAGTELYRVPNVQKINLRRHDPNDSWSMPLEWEAEMQRSQDSIEAAAEGHFRYEETTTDTSEGLVYSYRPNNEMTHPGVLAETIPFWDDEKFLLYKANIEMNRDRNDTTTVYALDLREKGRGMSLATVEDNTSFMSPLGALELNPNDKIIIRNTFCIEPGTPMAWYWTDSVVSRDIITSIEYDQGNATIPTLHSINQNYPNPFNTSTTITYTLPKRDLVTISVYDVLGREVSALVEDYQSAGIHSIHWDALGYPTGMYFYRIIIGTFNESKVMQLVR